MEKREGQEASASTYGCSPKEASHSREGLPYKPQIDEYNQQSFLFLFGICCCIECNYLYILFDPFPRRVENFDHHTIPIHICRICQCSCRGSL